MLTITFAQFPIFLTISKFLNAFAPAPTSFVYFILVLSGYKILEMAGIQICHVKVIFTLPTTLDISVDPHPAPPHWPKNPLAFVEWYSPLADTAIHAME